MADDISRLARLFRWCGMALVVASPLIVIATLLHPSRETAATIIASEARLIAAHALFTLYCLLILLGLPGLYAAQRGGMGRLGLAGFLTAFTGTYLIPVTGYFGFLAPVLARQSPDVLDAINQYNPVVIINGLAAICFIVGYAIFGIAMTRTVTLPRLPGVLVAVGGPAYLLGWGISQLVSTAAWLVAVLGAVSLGAGLAWPRYLIWQNRQLQTRDPSTRVRQHERRPFGESCLRDQALLLTASGSFCFAVSPACYSRRVSRP
jgi:hypothetical protein